MPRSDGEEALRKVTTFRPAIIISDLAMPGMNGLELVRRLQEQDRDITTIILTGQGTVETAVEAIKVGAYDYLTKPVDPQRLQILLEKVVERQQTLREVKVLRRQLRERGTFGPMIGHSPQMRKVYQVIEQAGPDRRVGADQRRERHGQGARRAHDPPVEPARGHAVRADQLRGDPRDAARERDLRPREGRVHRRRPSAGRAASSSPTTARCSSTRSPR